MDRIVQDFIQIPEDKKMTPAQTKVLQSAIQLFAEQGYSATSTAAVAEDAGVSQAVIFKYYKNKEGLLDQILNLAIDNLLPRYGNDFVSKLRTEAGQDSFEDFLSFLLHDRFQFMDENKNVLTILVSQLMIDKHLVTKLVQTLSDKFWLITEMIEQLAGPEARLSGQDTLRLVASQMILIFLEEERLGMQLEGTAVDQRLEQTKKIILAGIYKID